MGISANLLINARHGVRDVVTILEGIGAKEIEAEYKQDHTFISFKWNEEDRRLYVARSTEYGGLDGTILSFSQWGSATAILKAIGEVTGGFLQERDSDDDWTSIQNPHNGNARFILDHQILKRALTRASADGLADQVAVATGYERAKT